MAKNGRRRTTLLVKTKAHNTTNETKVKEDKTISNVFIGPDQVATIP
jgi:hypothetical protein